MPDEFSDLNEEERLKAENDFLKMKLMLEQGAQFGSMESEDPMPADIENQFLNYIMEFEKQSKNPVYIKVFDKINKPTHFKKVTEIPEDKIEEEWENLLDYLGKYSINFDVCSPNIKPRELYRFVTEELFEYEMSDMHIPGTTSNFIYDEFYPDAVYENSNAAGDECIKYILQKKPIEWAPHFRNENLRLNEHFPLSIEQFKLVPNNYKNAYDKIEINHITVINCLVEEMRCTVEGNYNIAVQSGDDKAQLSGNWKVYFEKEDLFDYWYIHDVQIEGIKF